MKKLFLLGVLSFGLLLPFGVNAEEENGYDSKIDSVEEEKNSANASVKVGEVEVPVYDVNINWDSLKYNWKYNYKTNKYEWAVETTKMCEISSYDVPSEDEWENYKYNLYTDSTCDTWASQDLTYEEFITNSENYYYYSGDYENSHIHIDDYSTGGRIIPSIKWKSEENYDFVQGNFKYFVYEQICGLIDEEEFENLKEYGDVIYTDSNCTTKFEYNNENQDTEELYALTYEEKFVNLETDKIDDNARHYFTGDVTGPHYANGAYYELKLDLTNEETPTNTPTAGDTIGTITVTIKAYE